MCVLEVGDGDRFVEEMRSAGVDVVVKRGGHDAQPAPAPELVAEIRRFRPELVHTHLVHADLHGQVAARGAGVTGLSSVHGTPSFYLRQPYRSRRDVGRPPRRAPHRDLRTRRVVAALDRARARPTASASSTTASTRTPGMRPPPIGRKAREHSRWPTRRRGRDRVAPDPGQGSRRPDRGVRPAAARVPRVKLLIAGDGPERDRSSSCRHSAARPGRCGSSGSFPMSRRSKRRATWSPSRRSPSSAKVSVWLRSRRWRRAAGGRVDIGSLPEVVQDGVTGIVVRPLGDGARPPRSSISHDDPTRRVESERAGRAAGATRFSLDAMVAKTSACTRSSVVKARAVRVLRIIDRLNVGGPALRPRC